MATLKSYFNGFWRYRYLLYNLISRDFKLKYRRSVLGVAWSVLNPLLMMLVMWAVFGGLFPDLRGGNIVNYPIFLLCGQLLFNFFRESTTLAMSSVLQNAPLLRKVYIPKYIFPLEKTCFGFVNCCFSFIALVLVMLFTLSPVHLTLPLAIYPLLTLFVFSLGVGLVLATMTVFFRDVMHMWEVFTTALMYFSAIFYDPEMMSGWVQQFIKFNPIYWYITGFRRVVINGEGLSLSMILVCGGCAAAALAFGLFVFKKNQDKFVPYL